MSRWFTVLLLAAILCVSACQRAEHSFEYGARIGVAVRLPDRICLAIDNSKLLPSATITLIAPADAARGMLSESARAQIGLRNAAACPGSRLEPVTNYYTLELTSGNIEQGRPLIALEARVPSVGAAHSFAACHAGNGTFLTAWDGAKPLEGRRLWKRDYVIGGQNTAIPCTSAETKE